MKNTGKNLITIVLILIMLTSSFMVACSADNKAESSEETQTTVQEEPSAENTEATELSDEAAATETKAIQLVKQSETDKSVAKDETSIKTATEATKTNTESTKATEAVKATEAGKECSITVEGHCTDKQIQLKGGESVYDILKKSGANVSARNTGYGLYVEGINGRFEFDEGPTSGWVYTVNGSRPSTSCDKYEVMSGDKIVWTYVEEV